MTSLTDFKVLQSLPRSTFVGDTIKSAFIKMTSKRQHFAQDMVTIVMLNLLPVNYATFNLNHNTATVSLSERSSSTWGQLYMLKISWFKGRSELWNRSARNKCIRPDRVVNL